MLNAPENTPKAKTKGSSSNHHFSGAMLDFGGVNSLLVFCGGCRLSIVSQYVQGGMLGFS